MPYRGGGTAEAAVAGRHAQRYDETVHGRRWWILGALLVPLVTLSTATTSLTFAIPLIAASTEASASELQWIVNMYPLVFAGLLLTGGALGDVLGRRRVLQCGLAIFGTASSLALFAESASQLIALRGIQGLGAALTMPGLLSTLTVVFLPEERPRAIGIWAACAWTGSVIGGLVGGWLLGHFWWGSVFAVNVPLVVIAFALVTVVVPTARAPAGHPLDLVGAGLSVGALATTVYGIIEGPRRGWSDIATLGSIAAAAALLALLGAWERRTLRSGACSASP